MELWINGSPRSANVMDAVEHAGRAVSQEPHVPRPFQVPGAQHRGLLFPVRPQDGPSAFHPSPDRQPALSQAKPIAERLNLDVETGCLAIRGSATRHHDRTGTTASRMPDLARPERICGRHYGKVSAAAAFDYVFQSQ